jgi:hypothetical protein
MSGLVLMKKINMKIKWQTKGIQRVYALTNYKNVYHMGSKTSTHHA